MSSSGCGKKIFRNDGKPYGTYCAFFRMRSFLSSVVMRGKGGEGKLKKDVRNFLYAVFAHHPVCIVKRKRLEKETPRIHA